MDDDAFKVDIVDGKLLSGDISNVAAFQTAAANGNAYAQYALACMHRYGMNVEQSDSKALEYLYKAAAQEHAGAICCLGYFHRRGILGFAQNDVKAAEFYQKAADKGSAQAQNNIGYMYDTGKGVAQNYVKAMEWYQKSAAQGNLYAHVAIGALYEGGYGVPEDYGKALEWYHKAADMNHPDAMEHIARVYLCDESGRKDYNKAMDWYQKAATLGSKYAESVLLREKEYSRLFHSIVILEQKQADVKEIKTSLLDSIPKDQLADLYMQLIQQHTTLVSDHDHLKKIVRHLEVCPAPTFKQAMAEFEIAAKNGIV
jgi:TPR repeat protein